jgi:hypothetical protein
MHIQDDAIAAGARFAGLIRPPSAWLDDVATLVLTESDTKPLFLAALPFHDCDWLLSCELSNLFLFSVWSTPMHSRGFWPS